MSTVTSKMRSDAIYVSPSVSRWLTWISKLEPDATPADAIADKLLREIILAKHPTIESATDDYWRKRKDLDVQAISEFKSKNAKQ